MYRFLKSFELLEPETIDEALQNLNDYSTRAKIIAGGLDLVLKMRRHEILAEYVISIQNIPELEYVTFNREHGLKIGALATLRQVEKSMDVKKNYPLLMEAINSIPKPRVKNMGTLVGNLCVGTPASDIAPVLMVLGAKFRIANSASEKIIPIDDFFIGVGKTALEPDEMVLEVLVPWNSSETSSAFLKLAKTKADIAKINVAVMLSFDEIKCRDAKIALGCVAPTVIRATKAEEVLKGEELDEEIIVRAAQISTEETRPISDVRSTAEYRKEMARILVRDALGQASERAKV